MDDGAADFRTEYDGLFVDPSTISPIELLMAVHLLYAMRHPDHFATGRRNHFLPACPGGSFSDFPGRADAGFTVAPQVNIGKYIADFGVLAKARSGTVVRGAVECDGHDFHERTKEQAKHDRSRDRYFQSCGIYTLRYTGSEIHADPLACACDALSILAGRSKP